MTERGNSSEGRYVGSSEPLRGLVHGILGTGKSRVIQWIRRFFAEALGWSHATEFLCVAFQNRMAASIGGVTLHSAADLGRPGDNTERRLSHSDIDNLYCKSGNLRWVLVDEISMTSDDLLGEFESQFTNAARQFRYHRRKDKSRRIFGGYNMLFFGDWWQLPPIPDSGALSKPPHDKCSHRAKRVLEVFWGTGPDSLNFFVELTEQKRIQDPWFNDVLFECRDGRLSYESYCFLFGLPTHHCGSWRTSSAGEASAGYASCGSDECARLEQRWRHMAMQGDTWTAMCKLECAVCQTERQRRNRLMEHKDPRVKKQPFVQAPYLHKNNEPKYHAQLVRAVENAKRGGEVPKHILWVVAEDTPANPAEIDADAKQLAKKRSKWLQYHDQKTAGIPGLCPFVHKGRYRVTEALSKKLKILKHSTCELWAWKLHDQDAEMDHGQGERMLRYLPRCVFLKFPEAEWQIKGLPMGVFP